LQPLKRPSRDVRDHEPIALLAGAIDPANIAIADEMPRWPKSSQLGPVLESGLPDLAEDSWLTDVPDTAPVIEIRAHLLMI
jgi:hypothetical protein